MSTLNSPIRNALAAKRLKRSQNSIKRPLRQLAVGRGIATALCAAGQPAKATENRIETVGTLDCGNGAAKIRQQQNREMRAPDSKPNTVSPKIAWKRCVSRKMDDVRSVTNAPPGCSLTTRTLPGKCGRSSAKPATHSWDGTNARQAKFSAFRNICAGIPDQPCHADILLLLANTEPGHEG